MRQQIEEKIEEIQQRPEHKRHRAVLVITLIIGCIIVAVWVLLLLPAQLKLS
jgi:predicted nucleic acid-binding Zn ribbon protein